MSARRALGLGRRSRAVRVRAASWLSELRHAGPDLRVTCLGFRAARNWGDALDPFPIEAFSRRPAR
jgi:hypothetical protein